MQKVDRIMEYDFLITILISIVNLSSFLYMYFFPKLSMELKHKKIRGIYVVFVILFVEGAEGIQVLLFVEDIAISEVFELVVFFVEGGDVGISCFFTRLTT